MRRSKAISSLSLLEGGADAVVDAVAEDHVVAGVRAADVEALGIGEDRLVVPGGIGVQEDLDAAWGW